MQLVKRIDALAKRHEITPAMKSLAHIIRLQGNKAAHEETFDEMSAKQIQSFAELFLLYTFTLPERVKLAHEQRAAAAGEVD